MVVGIKNITSFIDNSTDSEKINGEELIQVKTKQQIVGKGWEHVCRSTLPCCSSSTHHHQNQKMQIRLLSPVAAHRILSDLLIVNLLCL